MLPSRSRTKNGDLDDVIVFPVSDLTDEGVTKTIIANELKLNHARHYSGYGTMRPLSGYLSLSANRRM
jgi:hypothetical protein